MRVAVTGVAGFAGRWLAPALHAAGHEVVGWVRADSPAKRAAVAAVPGLAAWDYCDVLRPDAWDALWRRWRPQAVVHLAAQSSGVRAWRDPAGTFAANATGTLHLLESAARAMESGLPSPRLLLVGSSEVYAGCTAGQRLDESAPFGPRNPYGASKAAADLLGADYARARGLDVVRTRSFAHTGPGQETVYALSSFAEQIARAEQRGAPATVHTGDLRGVRDYSDVRDVVAAYVLLLERGAAGEAYNVCSGDGQPMSALLDLLCSAARVPVTVETQADRVRPADGATLIGDPTKCEKATGWTRRHTLAGCLADLLDDWRHRVAH